MNGYFKPLRRKLGVVTLLLACIFAAGWVRSNYKYDLVTFNGKPWKFIAGSFPVTIYLGQTRHQPQLQFFWMSINSDFNSFTDTTITGTGKRTIDLADLKRHDVINWRWDWAGFHLSDGRKYGRELRMCLLPYWSVVLPLTALSAWLLLSNVRTSKLRAIAEPRA